ncbi:SIMPL domain-containing protein [Trinickia acidisoli]|uniref:SIMPL domain-containing protein n=1 Tax=Trinickia acidisoli TaxID=2767482 RepID=UPI001A900297|nr:SIMPL domain-containing protein [Trinickia acidisoli]
MRKITAALTFAAVVPLAFAALPSRADTTLTQPVPSGVLSLSAQASADVPQDVVDITLFYEKEANDAASLTDSLNQHADAALKQARGVANVTAHTGTFTIYPMTDRDGHISSWRGRTEVVLESRDFAAATKLAGQINSTMQVGSVAFSLSPDAQRAAAEKLTTEAIKKFRDQAESSARAFGYGGYTIREVDVGGGNAPPPRPMFAMRAMAAAAPAAAPLPVEGGKSTVTVTVSGSVQMTR